MFAKKPGKLNIKMALLASELTLAIFVVILFICNCYPFGDNTFLMFDMKRQYVDYYSYLKSIYSGENNLFYSFSTTLGSGIFGFFVYYLSSPFLIILTAFPQTMLPLGIEIVIGIRLMLASFIMNLFIQRFFCDDYYTIVSSLSWSFSSFLFAHSMNMMWMDVVILLPIVIWTLENLISQEKYKIKELKDIFSLNISYVVSIFLIFYLNYYMSYQVMLFVIMWLVMRFVIQKDMFSIRKILQVAFNTMLGILLDAVFLIPTALELFNSPKDITRLGLELTGRNITPLEVFSKLGTMSYDIDEARFGDPQIFCGILFLVLIVLFFMDSKISKRERIGIGILFGILLVSFCIDLFNLIWHAGMEPSGHPYRQAFIWIFLSILCGSRFLMDIKEELSFKKLAIAAGIIAFIFIFSLSKRYAHVSTLTIVVSWGFLLGIFCILFFALKCKNKTISFALTILLGLIQVLDISINAIYTYNYQSMNNNHMSDYRYTVSTALNAVDTIKSNDTSFYRMENLTPRQQNDGMQYKFSGVTHYSSAGMTYVRDFLQELGYNDDTLYTNYGADNTKLADSILGIKYLISDGSVTVHSDYSKKSSETAEMIYENPYALPIAVGVHNYELPNDKVLEMNPFDLQEDIYQRLLNHDIDVFRDADVKREDYSKDGKSCCKYQVTPSINGELYMYIEGIKEYTQGLIIEINDEFKCSYGNDSSMKVLNLGTYRAGDTINISVIGDASDSILGKAIFVTEDISVIEDAYRSSKSMFATVKKVSSSSLQITTPNCTGVFVSIPYEKGWTITVDGIRTQASMAYGSLMYIPIDSNANTHYVDMQFTPEGFNVGLIISIIALGTILLLLLTNMGVIDEK